MNSFLQILIDAISVGSMYALVSLGIGLLFGILRLINFAHGDFITIGAYALIVPSSSAGATLLIGALPWYFMIPLVCLIVAIAALLADSIVFKRLRKENGTTLLISSLAVSYIIQNGLLMVYGGRPKFVDIGTVLTVQIKVGDLRIPVIQLITLGGTLFMLVALALFLKRSRYGIQMRAAAEDFKMAQYLGVNGSRVIGIAFVISGMLAAVVSLLFIANSGSISYQMGVPLALYAFVAVVVGGMGSLVGSVLGGFSIGVLVTVLQAYLPEDMRLFRDAFAFGVVILLLIFRPRGLIITKASIERV